MHSRFFTCDMKYRNERLVVRALGFFRRQHSREEEPKSWLIGQTRLPKERCRKYRLQFSREARTVDFEWHENLLAHSPWKKALFPGAASAARRLTLAPRARTIILFASVVYPFLIICFIAQQNYTSQRIRLDFFRWVYYSSGTERPACLYL